MIADISEIWESQDNTSDAYFSPIIPTVGEIYNFVFLFDYVGKI